MLSCFKFIYLGVALGMALKLYSSVEKKVNTKSKKTSVANFNICRRKQRKNWYDVEVFIWNPNAVLFFQIIFVCLFAQHTQKYFFRKSGKEKFNWLFKFDLHYSAQWFHSISYYELSHISTAMILRIPLMKHWKQSLMVFWKRLTGKKWFFNPTCLDVVIGFSDKMYL